MLILQSLHAIEHTTSVKFAHSCMHQICRVCKLLHALLPSLCAVACSSFAEFAHSCMHQCLFFFFSMPAAACTISLIPLFARSSAEFSHHYLQRHLHFPKNMSSCMQQQLGATFCTHHRAALLAYFSASSCMQQQFGSAELASHCTQQSLHFLHRSKHLQGFLFARSSVKCLQARKSLHAAM